MPSTDTLLVRSALFVPAIRERFIEKAPDAGADMICLDLEDSVALAEKPKGREMARDSMPGMKRTGYLMAVRVNSLQSGLIEDDLDAVVISDLEAIGLPEGRRPGDHQASRSLSDHTRKDSGYTRWAGQDIPVDRDGEGRDRCLRTLHILPSCSGGLPLAART